MQTRLIEIVAARAEPGSVATWRERIRVNPKVGLAGAAVGLALLPVGAVSAAGAAIAGGAAGMFLSRRAGVRQITQVTEQEARRFRDQRDQRLVTGSIYAAHPMLRKQNSFITAPDFNDHVLSEQMARIVTFLRSRVPLRSLVIDVVSEETGKIYGAVPTSAGKAKVSMEAGTSRAHSLELELNDPVIQPLPRDELFWMRLFPEIVSGVEGATGGRLVRTCRVNTSFGLSLDLAKTAGIGADWLKNRMFQISATFG